ncbi:MAG: M3 family oligoendopeptidase [Spirochaetaceae bacterium]
MSDAGTTGPLPRWSLESIYPGFESRERARDIAELEETLTGLENETSAVGMLRPLERCLDLAETLKTHAYVCYSTDTTNSRILEELNRLERFDVSLHRVRVRFRAHLAAGETPPTEELGPYGYVLSEERRLGGLQLPLEMEELAADLARSGAELWSRLQDSIGATLSTEWHPPRGSVDGAPERKTVVQLRSLAHHPDRSVRRKAFEEELSLWRQMEIPLSHAINGVKGVAVVMDSRRGFKDSLDRAVIESRMSQDSFRGLIGACEDALPTFHRYLRTKARALGQQKLAFFDIFAPIDGTGPAAESFRFSFDEAKRFICGEFSAFSPELGGFAEAAFDRRWIDAEPRSGKVGGAYCVSFPTVGESRILCNFDGSISGVSTLAHELGHAYHQELLKETPALLRQYPMPLAETASIFCENLVYRALMRELPEAQRLTALEAFLQDATQVIVDILSRFRFERELFRRRADHEVSPGDLCSLMSRYQQETYGDALDSAFLHPYMWAVKGHYYDHNLSFYNFPYAFGLLFSLALLEEYDTGRPGFPIRYRGVLERTGAASVDDVVRSAGLEPTQGAFRRRGLGVLETYVAQFEEQVR